MTAKEAQVAQHGTDHQRDDLFAEGGLVVLSVGTAKGKHRSRCGAEDSSFSASSPTTRTVPHVKHWHTDELHNLEGDV